MEIWWSSYTDRCQDPRTWTTLHALSRAPSLCSSQGKSIRRKQGQPSSITLRTKVQCISWWLRLDHGMNSFCLDHKHSFRPLFCILSLQDWKISRKSKPPREKQEPEKAYPNGRVCSTDLEHRGWILRPLFQTRPPCATVSGQFRGSSH